jgi:DNA glycosylase AlkZ-like
MESWRLQAMIDLRQLEKLRAPIYHVSPARRLRTISDAARFIRQVGFCWLFAPGAGNLELPSLFEAVKGRRGMQIFDWDSDSDKVWGWKSDLPAAHLAYYGKALAGKPVFVSPEILPFLLASAGTENLRHLYEFGGISYEANKIYRALESLGPQPTRALRAAAGLDTKDGNVRYHRALDELQRRLFVMPIGATNEGNNWPSQIFELVERWFPAQFKLGRRLAVGEARQALVARYLKTVLRARRTAIARLFGIPRVELDAVVEELAKGRAVCVQGEWILRRASRRAARSLARSTGATD